MRLQALIAALLALVPSGLAAQGWIEPLPGFAGPQAVVRVRTEVHARVEGRVAHVTVSEWFQNRGHGLGEGDYLYPLPGEAVFNEFSLFQGDEELRGETMDAGEARRIYEEIVRRRRDPALIELAGHGLLRARVFPIQPGETRRITLRYSQLLPRAGDGLQFRYAAGLRHATSPFGMAADRPNSAHGSGIGETTPLAFRLTVADGDAYRDPFSPTHPVRVERREGTIVVQPAGEISGDFSVFLPFAGDAVGMTLATYRPAGEDGYFMLTLSPGEARAERPMPRDVVVVVDVSGSMSGGKIEQARDALRQLLSTLAANDRFRLVAFGSGVETRGAGWSEASPPELASARRWVDELRAEGGTNIEGALTEAFRLEARWEALHIVLFLTDGLPSVGEQDPERLAGIAERSGGGARVFAFGIGYDVNTHLLDRLSEAGRGTTEYVEPGESVEEAVGLLAARIHHPVLTDLRIERQPVQLREILPERLPDLFAGEELVIFGRYGISDEPARGVLEIAGARSGRTERFRLDAQFPSHRTADAYIARLWASRKLGEIDRRIRLEGASAELVEEARQLALRHGLLSRYSAYLVQEPVTTSAVGSAPPWRDAIGGGMPPATPAPVAEEAAASGVAAVRAADFAAKQRAVVTERELVELSAAATAAAVPGSRELAGRLFRLTEGVWVDEADSEEKRRLRVEPYSDLYFQLLEGLPELRPIWRELERCIVAGANVSIETAAGGRSSMTPAELSELVRNFRGH